MIHFSSTPETLSPPCHSSTTKQKYEASKYDWVRHLWLASGCATLLICLFKSVFVLLISGSASTISSWLSWLFAALVAYVTADLATGIYHWAMDNYGTPETPIFGSQVVGFQRHHHQPWVISTQTIAYNCYIPAVGSSP